MQSITVGINSSISPASTTIMSLNTDLEPGSNISSGGGGGGGSFLSDLGPPIRRYPYEGIQQFLATWEMELCHQQEHLDVSEMGAFHRG